jgi:alkanesulfonate monooxygenase SsuD/methylene tetrahydromethanopterin reductase-like flavin-dependent oxidoreductase (luciferase family)
MCQVNLTLLFHAGVFKPLLINVQLCTRFSNLLRTLLAALASVTSQIRMGTLVTSNALRNPAVLARQALTIDHISNGRLEIGIGAGAPSTIDPTYKIISIDDWPFKERIRRLKEQVEIIDRLLRNSVSSYNGEFYDLEEAIMNPDPIQKPRPPLTVAAHAKASLKIAAEHADTWVSFGADFGSPPEVVVEKTRKRSEFLNKYCEQIGRDPASIRRSLLIFGSEANYCICF